MILFIITPWQSPLGARVWQYRHSTSTVLVPVLIIAPYAVIVIMANPRSAPHWLYIDSTFVTTSALSRLYIGSLSAPCSAASFRLDIGSTSALYRRPGLPAAVHAEGRAAAIPAVCLLPPVRAYRAATALLAVALLTSCH